MNQTVTPVAGLISLVALSVICVWVKGPVIEQDLGSRSRSALQIGGYDAARVSVEGRTITLSGAIASDSEREQAVGIVQAVWGVRGVEDDLTITAPPAVSAPAPAPAPKDDSLSLQDCQDRVNDLLAAQTIQFASYSAVIDESSHPLLTSIVQALGRCPEVTVRIGGHTDATGSDDLNQEISQARADSVRAHLIGLKMSPDRVEAVGYGESAPIADNKKAEGRAANRRIELTLREKP